VIVLFLLTFIKFRDFKANFSLFWRLRFSLSDSALREIKIPPGPRLKILNYVAASKANVTAHQGIGDFGVHETISRA
jgi:hypothetical protein